MSHAFLHGEHTGDDAGAFAALRVFKRSMMLHRRLISTLLADDELHPAQAGCLQALHHHDGISQSDIAAMLHVSRPTVSTMLQKMESSGLVERRPDQADQRLTRVYLTSAGHAAAERMREVLVESLKLSLGSLSEAEVAEFTRLLGLINANVEAALVERGASPAWHHPHETGEPL